MLFIMALYSITFMPEQYSQHFADPIFNVFCCMNIFEFPFKKITDILLHEL